MDVSSGMSRATKARGPQVTQKPEPETDSNDESAEFVGGSDEGRDQTPKDDRGCCGEEREEEVREWDCRREQQQQNRERDRDCVLHPFHVEDLPCETVWVGTVPVSPDSDRSTAAVNKEQRAFSSTSGSKNDF